MADPLQPPLPQPPNWGAYVAGMDTIQYYYLIESSTADTEDYFFDQKISNYVQENIFKAAVVAVPPVGGTYVSGVGHITGGNFRGDSTEGVQVAGKAFIPNALPGGYTP